MSVAVSTSPTIGLKVLEALPNTLRSVRLKKFKRQLDLARSFDIDLEHGQNLFEIHGISPKALTTSVRLWLGCQHTGERASCLLHDIGCSPQEDDQTIISVAITSAAEGNRRQQLFLAYTIPEVVECNLDSVFSSQYSISKLAQAIAEEWDDTIPITIEDATPLEVEVRTPETFDRDNAVDDCLPPEDDSAGVQYPREKQTFRRAIAPSQAPAPGGGLFAQPPKLIGPIAPMPSAGSAAAGPQSGATIARRTGPTQPWQTAHGVVHGEISRPSDPSFPSSEA